jgi:hypothetical protein
MAATRLDLFRSNRMAGLLMALAFLVVGAQGHFRRVIWNIAVWAKALLLFPTSAWAQ